MVAAVRSSNGRVSLRPDKCCWACSLQSFCMRKFVCMEKDTSCWLLQQIKYLCNRRCQKSAGIQRVSILQVQFLCLWPFLFKRYTCFLEMFFNLGIIAFCPDSLRCFTLLVQIWVWWFLWPFQHLIYASEHISGAYLGELICMFHSATMHGWNVMALFDSNAF